MLRIGNQHGKTASAIRLHNDGTDCGGWGDRGGHGNFNRSVNWPVVANYVQHGRRLSRQIFAAYFWGALRCRRRGWRRTTAKEEPSYSDQHQEGKPADSIDANASHPGGPLERHDFHKRVPSSARMVTKLFRSRARIAA